MHLERWLCLLRITSSHNSWGGKLDEPGGEDKISWKVARRDGQKDKKDLWACGNFVSNERKAARGISLLGR